MIQLMPGLRQFGTVPPDGAGGAVCLIGSGEDLALVDCGNAANYPLMRQELAQAGFQPRDIQSVYITHGHSDHHEGAVLLRQKSDANVFGGKADRSAMETGDYWGTAGF